MDMVTGQGSTLDEAQISDWMVVPFTKIGNTEGGAGFAPVSAPNLHKGHHRVNYILQVKFQQLAILSFFHLTWNSSARPVDSKYDLYNLILKVELTGTAGKLEGYSKSDFSLLLPLPAYSMPRQLSLAPAAACQLVSPLLLLNHPPDMHGFDHSPQRDLF